MHAQPFVHARVCPGVHACVRPRARAHTHLVAPRLPCSHAPMRPCAHASKRPCAPRFHSLAFGSGGPCALIMRSPAPPATDAPTASRTQPSHVRAATFATDSARRVITDSACDCMPPWQVNTIGSYLTSHFNAPRRGSGHKTNMTFFFGPWILNEAANAAGAHRDRDVQDNPSSAIVFRYQQKQHRGLLTWLTSNSASKQLA